VQALRNLGLAKIVANPSLITLNGRPAQFHVGGVVPFGPIGSEPKAINFREYGTIVRFLPEALGDGKLRLEISFEVSRIDAETRFVGNGIVAPGFVSSSVSTTVEVPSGQTLALGGLSERGCESKNENLPLLAYFPVLGRLAGFGELTPENSVYLLLVTPHLIPTVAEKEQFQFEVRVCEGNPDGSREAETLKVLASPTLVTLDGATADFNIGGEVPIPDGARSHTRKQFGTHLSVTAKDRNCATVFLDASLETTSLASGPDDRLAQLNGRTAKTAGRVRFGEPVRIMLDQGDGKKLWCDVTVTVANP
jgi:Flp pilus assembly secretin CpaC